MKTYIVYTYIYIYIGIYIYVRVCMYACMHVISIPLSFVQVTPYTLATDRLKIATNQGGFCGLKGE